MRRKGNRFKQLRDANKKRQDDAKAAREAEKAIQEVKPTAAPPDPPPAASSEAKPGSPSSLPHSIEENLVVSTPQLGSGSTGTASSAPGDAAQPKALVGCPNKIGRRKGESGRQTAAATEARVAQEARDFVLNAPVPPKEPKFLPDSSGMYGRPDANRLWPSADHNREQPKPRPHERRAAETLKQAEQAFEDQKTLAEATTGVWEEMEQALSEAAQFRKEHAAKCAEGNCVDCSAADEAVLPQKDDLALLIASHMPASFLNTDIPSAVSEENRHLLSKVAGLKFRLQLRERGAKGMAKELKVCKERLADAQAQLGGLRQAVSDLKARVPKAKGTNGAGAYSMTHAPNWRLAWQPASGG